MSTLYLDSNELIRAYQREPDVGLALGKALESGPWSLVLSEANVIELIKGLDAGAPGALLEHILPHRPKWVLINTPMGLDDAELRGAAAAYREARPPKPLAPVVEWSEAAAQLASLYGVRLESPIRFLDVYDPGSVSDHLLKQAQEQPERAARLRDGLGRATNARDAARTQFSRVVESYLRDELGMAEPAAGELTRSLWDHPDFCPANRLYIELTAALLRDPQRPWDVNTYFDHKHAMVIPYVDAFVTAEGGIRAAIRAFDDAVRRPAQLVSFSDRVFARVEDAVNKLGLYN